MQDDPAAAFVDPVFGSRGTSYWLSKRGGWPYYGAGGGPFPVETSREWEYVRGVTGAIDGRG